MSARTLVTRPPSRTNVKRRLPSPNVSPPKYVSGRPAGFALDSSHVSHLTLVQRSARKSLWRSAPR